MFEGLTLLPLPAGARVDYGPSDRRTEATVGKCLRHHTLGGEWTAFHDRHVRPDLVLIYQKSGADTLRQFRPLLRVQHPA